MLKKKLDFLEFYVVKKIGGRLLYYCYLVPQFADSLIRGFLAGYFNRELRDPPVSVVNEQVPWEYRQK